MNPQEALSRIARSLRSWIGISALLCASCATSWDAPTYYVFENLDPALQPRLKVAVASFGYQPLDAGEASDFEVGAQDFAFRLSGLRSTSQLASAHKAIESTLREAGSPARMRRAEIHYASVVLPHSATGTSLVAQGRVMPGSTVRLDAGSGPPIVAPVLEGGVWSVSIPSSPELERRGGWIYGEAEKDGARQYFRLNLLTGREEALDASELPQESPLRGGAN